MSIEVKDLSFGYGRRPVLCAVSFSAEAGELLSILGPNGVGKSTLFRCILGLLTPSSGRIEIDGRPVSAMTPRELSRKIAYIPQSHSSVFQYSVLDMVLMGTASRLGSFSSPGEPQRELALAAMERVGISHLKNRSCCAISGGERQLVLIARAIAQQAGILVMDEPSANLDFGNRVRFLQTVRALTEEGYTVLQSTHDPEEAYRYSDRILALSGGKVLAWGTPQETVTAENIRALYGISVEISSLRDDAVRICLPAE